MFSFSDLRLLVDFVKWVVELFFCDHVVNVVALRFSVDFMKWVLYFYLFFE